MSQQNGSAAHEAAVFIDIENMGSPPATPDSEAYFEFLGHLADGMLSALQHQEKLVVKEAWAVARAITRTKSRHSGKMFTVGKNPAVQIRVTETLSARGIDVSWSAVSADTALIREVRRRFIEGLLPTWVVLASGDTDFIPLAKELEKAGHGIIVIMRETKNKKWKRVSHGIITTAQLHKGTL